MTKEEFINNNKIVKQIVTPDFASKAISTVYNLSDAVNEIIDNAIDNRYGNTTDITISYDSKKKTLVFEDKGCGIKNIENIFTLGHSSHSNKFGTIGKFGIGIKGATATIARYCRDNFKNPVGVLITTARDGNKSVIKAGYFRPNKSVSADEFLITEPEYHTTKKSEHYTKIVFTNVKFSKDRWNANIKENISNTYSETFNKELIGLSVHLGYDGVYEDFNDIKTTFGTNPECECPIEGQMLSVGPFRICVKWDYIPMNKTDKETKKRRVIEESGLRFYDASTGRLISKEISYWSWFTNHSAQPSICGLRMGVFIDSSIECYNLFGVNSTKNRITYAHYFKKEEFKALVDFLSEKFTKYTKLNSNLNGGEEVKSELDNNLGITFIEYSTEACKKFNVETSKAEFNKSRDVYKLVDDKCFVAIKYWGDKAVMNLVKKLIVANKRNEVAKNND